MLRRSHLALVAAAVLGAGVLMVWFASFRVDLTSWADRAVQAGFLRLEGTRAEAVATQLAHVVDPPLFALWTLLVIGAALLRRRPRLALAALIILAGANVTTQVLKHVTAGPRAVEVVASRLAGGEQWPSGHTTAAMTLALCVVLISPARLRPWAAAVGGCLAVGVVYSILMLGWHLPSDVLGGFLVATAWTALTVAGLWELERIKPSRVGSARSPAPLAVLAPVLLAAVALAGTVAAVVALRPQGGVARALEHTALMAGAPLIAVTALALAAGLALALRR